jgi:hypothetical protein
MDVYSALSHFVTRSPVAMHQTPPPPPRRKLTPVEVLQRLLHRLERRMESLQRANWTGIRWSLRSLRWKATTRAGRSDILKDDEEANRLSAGV